MQHLETLKKKLKCHYFSIAFEGVNLLMTFSTVLGSALLMSAVRCLLTLCLHAFIILLYRLPLTSTFYRF